MRRTILVAVVLSWTVTSAHAAEFTGSVDKIADGDTFWVYDANACYKIRLCGIDAPEQREPGHQESAAALKQLVQGKVLRCIQVGNGTPCDGRSKPTNYDRIVAQCFADGADIAVPMVEQGFACEWVMFSGGAYSQGGKGNRCKARSG